jgi:hypothetical protein
MPALIWINTSEEGPAPQQVKRVLAEYAAAALGWHRTPLSVFDIVFGERSTAPWIIRAAKLISSHVARPIAKGAMRMGEGKHIVLLNIRHYKQLLASETDPDRREALSRQLAEQEAKLQEMERKTASSRSRSQGAVAIGCHISS